LGKLLQLDAAWRAEDMGTYGIFSYIFPDDEDYAEGLAEDEWILENARWLTELLPHTTSRSMTHTCAGSFRQLTP